MPVLSPDANLAGLLAQWTAAFGWHGRAAFRCGDDIYTHGEVHRGAARAASVLRGRGIGPGDRVVIALPCSIEFVWTLLGTVRLGAIAMIADPEASILPPGEVGVCAPGRHKHVITPDELVTALPAAPSAPVHPVAPDTPAYTLFGVLHGHGDPEERFFGLSRIGLRENDVLVSAAKAYDSIGLDAIVFCPLFSGACAVLEPGRRSPVAERARRHRASVLFAGASFFDRPVTREPFASLRLAVSQGGAAAPVWLGRPLLTM